MRNDWNQVAGAIAEFTYPIGFSGAKLRKLQIKVTGDGKPPWGGWKYRGTLTVPRRAFTKFRADVNKHLAPLEVDHIEFIELR